MRTANVASRKIVTLVEAETQKDIGWQTTIQIIQIVNRAIKKEKRRAIEYMNEMVTAKSDRNRARGDVIVLENQIAAMKTPNVES